MTFLSILYKGLERRIGFFWRDLLSYSFQNRSSRKWCEFKVYIICFSVSFFFVFFFLLTVMIRWILWYKARHEMNTIIRILWCRSNDWRTWFRERWYLRRWGRWGRIDHVVIRCKRQFMRWQCLVYIKIDMILLLQVILLLWLKRSWGYPLSFWMLTCPRFKGKVPWSFGGCGDNRRCRRRYARRRWFFCFCCLLFWRCRCCCKRIILLFNKGII